MAGFTCGWCSDQCSIVEECSTLFYTETDNCPSPRIGSVQPNRGPREGGTRVTISGTDLGASYSDILNVTLRSDDGLNVECSLAGRETYVLGRQIVCETQLLPGTGEYTLYVYVQRETSPQMDSSPYFVEQPQLTGVDPEFGPKSGGIEVVVRGRNLNIGNTEETRIELNGIECDIRE